AHVLARKDRESTHEPESLTEASLGLWRVNVTSASRINATTPIFGGIKPDKMRALVNLNFPSEG
ncbi:MAG: hypothetical protein VB124_01630, partial [Burkholderia sp.]